VTYVTPKNAPNYLPNLGQLQIWEPYKFGGLANLGRVFQICPANLEHPCNLEANLGEVYRKLLPIIIDIDDIIRM
jgi:hypothetical protein